MIITNNILNILFIKKPLHKQINRYNLYSCMIKNYLIQQINLLNQITIKNIFTNQHKTKSNMQLDQENGYR